MTDTSLKKLEQEAIHAAINCDWEKAIDYNLTLLKKNPNSIPTLNRLAKAYLELGKRKEAQQTYRQVLKLDPYNRVATKQLSLLPQKSTTSSNTQLASEDFIESPGLTKTVSLIKITNKDTLASLAIRQPLQLKANGKLVTVYTHHNRKIGALPDDLSRKLLLLLKIGYRYSVCIKSTQNNKITVFLRETYRPPQYQALPSFAPQTTYLNIKQQLI